MFEEEDSEEELVMSEDPRSPTKMKKHSKPSFKFSKKEKFYKPKEKDKEEKREKKEKERREKEEKERREREDKELREREEEHKKKEHKKKEKEEKLRFKKKKIAARAKTAGDPDQRPIFGMPLAMAVTRNKCHDGIQLPAIFRDCIDYIEESGLSCEGIYRISGVKSKVQALKDSYNRGLPVALHEHEHNIVASLFKQFLRELPEPVLTTELLPKFEQASGLKNVMQTVKQFQALLEQLPTPNRLLLSWTIVHMTHVIANEKKNKMSLQNVSIVLSPTLQISHRLLNIFFTHYKILFRDAVIKKHVPPLRPVTSRWSLELPDSPSSLEEELRKQESVLTQLHQELLGVKDSEKEDKLWEVQRVVTQLKRKLKNTKKAQEATLAAVKREAEMKKKKARDESKKSTGETVETPDKPDKSTSQTIDVKEENAVQGSQVVTVVQLHHDTSDTGDGGDTVDSSNRVESKVEPPRMTKLKVKPVSESKSQESDSTADVGDSDRIKKDETKGDVSEPAKETCEVVEEKGGKEGKLGNEEREDPVGDKEAVGDKEPVGDKEAVGEREEMVSDRGSMVSDRGDTAESMGGTEEVVTSVTEDVDVVMSTETTDVDKPEEAVVGKEGGRDEGRSRALEREYMALMLEEEELIATGDELRQKIATERSEMERLEQEIADLRIIHEGLYDSDELWSESSDESLDEEELQETLQRLIEDNRQLEESNLQLCSKIPEERQICLDVKVQIRMIQQWQHAPAGMMDPLIEREASVGDGPW